ncbi:hypothetical protein ACFRFL_14030 [Streptomyces sp. NPDC056708]|uniref:hypothetical protein n=1 Tax=unclassified Streptomyces TaxID=2593676 RepID=UPI0036A100CE
MSPAYLHAVPDPEPGPEEGPGPGERPAPVTGVVALHPPVEDDGRVENPPVDEDDEDQDETAEDGVEDLVDEDDEGAERRGWMPDLRPYYDVRPLAELGPLAVEVGRVGGPPLLRVTSQGLRALTGGLLVLARGVGVLLVLLARGVGVLLVLLAGWLSGSLGKHGSIGARFAGAGFLTYAVAKTAMRYPGAWWVVLVALLAAVILAGLGHIKAPEPKSQKKALAKKKGAGEKDKKESPKGKDAPTEDGDEEAAEVSKEDAPPEPRRGLPGRLAGRLKSGSDTPAQPSPDGAEEGPGKGPEEVDGEIGEDAEETPVENSPEPSREAAIRALHHLYRGGSGVLHTALAQHLQLPHTKAVKRVLGEAGITHRPGVRTPAGNGPGVHHTDFPPLPPSQEGGQGSGVVAGQTANANANNAANVPEEGLGAYRTEWTKEELKRGFRSVPDPDRGASASKIEYRPSG